MVKALYGTHSGGARWHDRLFDILQDLSFKPSQVDPMYGRDLSQEEHAMNT